MKYLYLITALALSGCGSQLVSADDVATIRTIEGLGKLAEIAMDLETLNR